MKHQSSYDASQGSPNLEILQFLQENWTLSDIASVKRVCAVVVASGTDGIEADIPTGAKIIDAHVICTGANGSGSMTIKDGAGNAITDAMACTTDKAIARAGSIDDAYNIVPSTGVVVVANGADDKGTVYITYTK